MEMVVSLEAIRQAKIQLNRHNQQTNTQLFLYRLDRCPFSHPTNSVRALKFWGPILKTS